MIGLFNDNFPPVLDGVALTVQNYAYWLHTKGHEVSVITPYAPGASKILKETPYPVYRFTSVPIPFRAPYRFGMPYFSPIFLQEWRGLKFDLVHAHCPFTTSTLARQAAKSQHIPMVATFHSKYRQDFEHNVPSKDIVDMMVKRVVRFYEKADEVWIPLPAVEETLREYGYKGAVTVVENGNDFSTPMEEIKVLRQSMREELGLEPDETMLLYVGQHTWEKNIGFFLESLSLIKEQPWQLFMVGTGYAVHDIRTKIKQLGLAHKVTLLGNIIDRERLKRIDAAADLFLFPSLYDTCGLVVREAAAMHTPSLMLEDSTAATAIQKDVNGFLTPQDTNAYAQRIAYLMQHPEELKKVGNKASKTLARSWEDVMDEIILRYKDIRTAYVLKNGIII